VNNDGSNALGSSCPRPASSGADAIPGTPGVSHSLSLLGWEMTTAPILAALGGSLAIGLIINCHERRF